MTPDGPRTRAHASHLHPEHAHPNRQLAHTRPLNQEEAMSMAPALAHAAPRPVDGSVQPLLRPVPVPATEPPFDDELASSGHRVAPLPRYGAAPAPVRPDRALRVLPGGRTAAGAPGAADSDVLPGPLLGVVGVTGTVGTVEDREDREDREDEPQLRRIAELPDPRPLAGQLAQAVVEVLAGDRPITQLLTWVDERIYTELSALAPSPRTSPALSRARTVLIRPQDRPKVRSIHVGRPAAGVAEIAARVQVNGRSRAVALRLEEWRGRWRCSALIVG